MSRICRTGLVQTLFLTFLCYSQVSLAAVPSRFQIQFGIGQGTATSVDARTKFVENPMAFGFQLDHPFSEAYYIFAEHLRSYGASGTSMGLTGLGLKFYPWMTPYQTLAAYSDAQAKTVIAIDGYATYFGVGSGFAQASVPANGKNPAIAAVGPYLSGKAGMENSFSKNWAYMTEANFALTLAGSGAVQYFNIVFGFIYSL